MPEKQRTVIVGGGIIGATAAFFITRHPKFDAANHEIVLVEAVNPACAASGKAGGLLSKTAFPQSLGPLSFKLHAQLAEEFDGADAWGYRRVTTVSVESSQTSKGEAASQEMGKLDWLRKDMVDYFDELGGPDEFAQVHPYFFTNFMIDHLQEKGLLRLEIGKVTELRANSKGECVGVTYERDGTEIKLDATDVVVAAGPWTSKLIETCPVYGMKVPSITVRPTKPVSAYALFTELELADVGRVSPEIYARKDEVYICGETLDDPLPETADLITVDERYGDALFSYGSALSEEIAGGEIKVRQACYLPVVDSPFCSGPFVGKTNVPHMLMAAGHTCWGINNAPATGLLLAEVLLEGRAHTSNIRGLTPAAYFDASKALTPSSPPPASSSSPPPSS